MALTQVQGGMIVPSTTLTTPIVATTMGVGGATPASSGAGITFPATQSASTDANTLDDYEEGTWTPAYVGSGGNPTYTPWSGTQGIYVKVGRTVTCFLNIGKNGSATGGSGDLRISGLPFAATSVIYGQLVRATSWGWSPASPDYKVQSLYIGSSASYIYLWDADTSQLTLSTFTSASGGAYVTTVFSYIAAS